MKGEGRKKGQRKETKLKTKQSVMLLASTIHLSLGLEGWYVLDAEFSGNALPL